MKRKILLIKNVFSELCFYGGQKPSLPFLKVLLKILKVSGKIFCIQIKEKQGIF